MTKIVGLTGGIGSGKSQTRRFFEELGVPAWDADLIARDIHQNPSHPVLAKITAAFDDVLDVDGRLAREKMRERLASDATANATLKALLKPWVMATLAENTAAVHAPYVIWESAMLIEENIKVDRILVVDCSEETQLHRVHARNPDWTDQQILAMLRLQASRTVRLQACDDMILNDTTVADLRAAVEKQHLQYLSYWS